MKSSNILIYLGILAILAGYVYFGEIRQKEKTRVQKEQAEKIVDLKKDDIVSVELQSQDRGKIELKRPAGHWVLLEPVKTKGDDEAIDTLLHSIVTGKREKTVKDKDVDWAEFGLDNPSLVAALGTKDRVTRIAFGSANPSKTSYYVRVDENPQLLLVTDAFKNAVNKTVFDLRDKAVVAVSAPDVSRLTVSKDGVETEILREEPDKWVMTKPERMRVKKSPAENAVRMLATLRARNILDEPSDKPDEYGFDKPALAATLAGKEREETLIVGKASGDEKSSDRYATIKGHKLVYVIDGKALLAMKIDPASLQDRSVFSVDPQGIDKITVTLDSKTWEVAREKDNKWRLEKPEQKKGIEAWTVARILWDIKDVEWKAKEKPGPDELSRFHLDKPALVVALEPKDGKPRIEFKAGWVDKKQTQAPAGASDAAAEKSSTAAETPAEPKEVASPDKPKDPGVQAAAETPETVYAIVEPQEEPGTVFVLDGAFLKRLRDDLKDLGDQGK